MNALTFARPLSGERHNLVTLYGKAGSYKYLSADYPDCGFEKLYLASLDISDELLDEVTERVLSHKSRIIISVSRTLEEVGLCDAKHGMSPVMRLHRLGLLQECDALAGGVWLDKDDVDLAVQCEKPLILTPSYDMGMGHGIPEAVMYFGRGLKMGLGSEDCSFNPEASADYEARLISTVMNAHMKSREALPPAELERMLAFEI